MDLWLIPSSNQTHIRATSIHGMLWLQTHFEIAHWEAIAGRQVLLSNANAEILAIDATKAGLIINSVPSIKYSDKYSSKLN